MPAVRSRQERFAGSTQPYRRRPGAPEARERLETLRLLSRRLAVSKRHSPAGWQCYRASREDVALGGAFSGRLEASWYLCQLRRSVKSPAVNPGAHCVAVTPGAQRLPRLLPRPGSARGNACFGGLSTPGARGRRSAAVPFGRALSRRGAPETPRRTPAPAQRVPASRCARGAPQGRVRNPRQPHNARRHSGNPSGRRTTTPL